MSASLVGSEMCIRDRSANPQSAQSFAIGVREPNLEIARAGGPEGNPRWACLLYTSDAADDM
eukprot:10510086-Alexandrium_andersonii.AAC.1